MIVRILRTFHRAFIVAVVVFAGVYMVVSIVQATRVDANARHLAEMQAQSAAMKVDDAKATLSWGDLLRHGESSEGTPFVREKEGRPVRMAGYMVPLDGAARNTTEFLLVPYYGACIHVPPPPSHQIVHVKVATPGGVPVSIYDPVWVEGVFSLTPQPSVYGEAGFSMEATSVEIYSR